MPIKRETVVERSQRWLGLSEQLLGLLQVDFGLGYAASTGIGAVK